MPSSRDFIHGPWRAVPVLGVTQILSWGTIFYTPVLIVPLIAAEHGWSMAFTMGGFSAALLVAGLIAPYVGRSIDRFGGQVTMTFGSLVAALGRIFGAAARRPITALTLAGGFASTVSWPATHFLLDAVGWRGTYLIY